MNGLKELWDQSLTPRLSLGRVKLPTGKLVTVLALAAAGLALLASLLAFFNSLRESRLLREQARTLPVLRRAAQRYLDDDDARDGAEEPDDLPF